MTDTREKLIELMIAEKRTDPETAPFSEWLADYLLANGVRLEEKQATSEESKQFASDNNVGGKWIPVTERLPDLIPCNAGTVYSEAVNVLTTGRKVLTAIWNGEDFIADAEFWEAENEEITHWTPVLLPLPEPPKEVNNG